MPLRWVAVRDPTATHRDEYLYSTAPTLRAAPCLCGLYSVVALLSHALPEGQRFGGIHWPGRTGVTFCDALTAVRR